MDYVESMEIAQDLANNIINGDYLISDNHNDITLYLNNNVIMDAILLNLREYYGEGTEADTRYEDFIIYNRNILENNNENNNENRIINILTPTTPSPPPFPPLQMGPLPPPPPPPPNVTSLNTSSISASTVSSLPDHVQTIITCPLTLQIMSDPVVDTQGNTYERSAIETWIASQSSPTDPLNRQPISNVLIPNMAIRSLIQLYFPSAGGRRKLTKKKKSKKFRKTKKRYLI